MKRPSRATITATKIAGQSAPTKPKRLLASSIAILCGLVLNPTSGSAQTWNAVPANNNWNNAPNWTPANIPDAAGETAVFGASTITGLDVTSDITIDGITFNAAAPAYTITNAFSFMRIDGGGIVNSSAAIQTVSNGNFLEFYSATAGANLVINNDTDFSVVNFFDATLGSATINNSGSSLSPLITGSVVVFNDNSTAGTGIILNSGDNTQTLFIGLAGTIPTAGDATITNSGTGSSTVFRNASVGGTAVIENSGDGSFIQFQETSDAEGATLTNSGTGSQIDFSDTSTAGTATLNNNHATAFINFLDGSTAGGSTINNSGSGTSAATSSLVGFFNTSNAGTATINNSGDNVQTVFSDDSSAAGATIDNGGPGSSTVFVADAKAGTANIDNSGTSSFTTFSNTSAAGTSTIANTGSGSEIDFFDTSTAEGATLTNTHATGLINFFDSSTAEGSTINNAGSGASPATSSIVGFFNSSNAGAATINNSGTNVQTVFSDSSSANSATIDNLGTGSSTVFVAGATAADSGITNSGPNSITTFSNTSTAGDSTISNTGDGSEIDFFDTTTAGTATLNNTNPTALINFFDSSTAGTSTINNTGSGAFPAAVVSFFNTSKAGGATINNSGDNVQTLFSESSTANTAKITNSGDGSSTFFAVSATAANSTIMNTGPNSFTSFVGQSTAGNARITSAAPGTLIDFADTARAGRSILTNSDPTSIINFLDSSTAENATINNNGSGAFPSSLVSFFNSSTAASATINNNGDNTQALFSDNSTAASAKINNIGAGSTALFVVNATAGNSTIDNSGAGSTTDFNGASSAGNSTINNTGSGSGANFFNNTTAANSTLNNVNGTATISFFDAATAGNATIRNNGSGSPIGSIVGFFGSTSAGTATLTNSGANSQTLFSDDSTAANSTVINNGTGSATIFIANASGGSVRLVNANATSFIDISGLAKPGTTAGSIEGNGSLRLGSKTLTVGSLNLSTTFSGDIKDGGFNGGTGGALAKVGSGNLTLSGANTFTGGITLHAGGIIVGSSQALGNGNFTLNSGTLSATGPTRGINVRGNYTQNGGTVQFRIGGASTGQYDRLTVTGKASLAGRMNVRTVNGFNPQAENRFIVVTAAGGVTGTFATVDDNLSSGALKFGVTYDPNNVILEILQSAFLPFAETPNQRAVAAALDRVVSDPDAVDLITYLDTLPASAIPGALDLIAPEEMGAMFEITRSAARIQAFTIQHRLDEIHAATAGLPPVLGKDGKTSKDVVEPARRFGVFANGHGEFVSVGSTSNARGYDFDSGGFTLGLDYRFSNHFAAGVLFNYTRTDAQLNGNGNIQSDAVRGGVYASVFGHGAYLNAYIGGAGNDYDTKRSGLQGSPRGNTNGSEFTTFVSAGYDAHAGHLTFGPIVSYHYTSLNVDSFNERGSLAPLRVALQDGVSSRTNLGARASYDWHIGGMVLAYEARASWQHEFGDVEQTTDSRFLFGGPTFTVNSARVGRDSFVLSTGFSLQITPAIAAYAYYDGELGRGNYDANNIIGGIRAEF